MKSKETFTRTEADEIIRLIQEKLKADTNRQKALGIKSERLVSMPVIMDLEMVTQLNSFLVWRKLKPPKNSIMQRITI